MPHGRSRRPGARNIGPTTYGRTYGGTNGGTYGGSYGGSSGGAYGQRAYVSHYGAGESQSLLGVTGLQFRSVSPTTMTLWTALQAVGLWFGVQLYWEAKGHLELYEHSLATQCSRRHLRHNVCVSPIWNVSAWERFALEGRGMYSSHLCAELLGGGRFHHRRHRRKHLDSHWKEKCRPANHTNHSFEFATRSSPPTFLVSVDAVAVVRRGQGNVTEPPQTLPADVAEKDWQEEEDTGDLAVQQAEDSSRWSLRVERLEPTTGAKPHVKVVNGGAGVLTVEDDSEEAAHALATKGSVVWKVLIENRGSSSRNVEFEAFVEDAVAAPKGGFKSARCSFVRAWKRFNQQHQGHRHDNASLSCDLLGFVLPLNGVAAVVVLAARLRHTYLAKREPERSTGCSFHCVVIAKFFVADIMQQVCIVVYLLNWYESDGLRCQLCLFHPGRCEDASPFGMVVTVTLVSVVLSALSNQLLVGLPGAAAGHEQDPDVCGRIFARILAASVSLLPLTTGSFFAGPAIFAAPTAVQVLLVTPCLLGWITVAFLALGCLSNCCED